MRVLHFAESFSQPTETFIKRFVEKSCLFAEVGVVAFNICDVDEQLKAQIDIFEINDRLFTRKTIAGSSRYLFEKLTGSKRWYAQLNQVLETFKPDIIHCHFGNEGVNMMEFNVVFKHQIPFVTSFYGYDISSQPNYDKIYKRKLSKLLKYGNAFFAEGPELKRKVIAAGADEKQCLINPLLIPCEEYPLKKHYRSKNDPIKFLFIGRFVEKKGFHLFLKAVAQLQGRINKFSIDIVGDGPYKEVYESIISEYNLNGVINWHGMVTHAGVISMMKNYDFLVHPSVKAKDNDSEGGAPTILIEAQAIGLPVITSNHADIPYVMGYHEFISTENDIESLKFSIENIVNCENIVPFLKKGFDKVNAQHNLKFNDIYESNLQEIITKN